jgi:hypothetical protein
MGWAYLTQEEVQRTIEPNTLTEIMSFCPLCRAGVHDVGGGFALKAKAMTC